MRSVFVVLLIFWGAYGTVCPLKNFTDDRFEIVFGRRGYIENVKFRPIDGHLVEVSRLLPNRKHILAIELPVDDFRNDRDYDVRSEQEMRVVHYAPCILDYEIISDSMLLFSPCDNASNTSTITTGSVVMSSYQRIQPISIVMTKYYLDRITNTLYYQTTGGALMSVPVTNVPQFDQKLTVIAAGFEKIRDFAVYDDLLVTLMTNASIHYTKLSPTSDEFRLGPCIAEADQNANSLSLFLIRRPPSATPMTPLTPPPPLKRNFLQIYVAPSLPGVGASAVLFGLIYFTCQLGMNGKAKFYFLKQKSDEDKMEMKETSV
jgi:hypothetical protein